MIDTLKALSEESRLRILALLIDGDLCVCDIESELNMTQSNVSRHLSALKSSGIVDSRKKAQWAYYGINEQFKSDNQFLWLFLKEKLSQPPYNTGVKSRDALTQKEGNATCLSTLKEL